MNELQEWLKEHLFIGPFKPSVRWEPQFIQAYWKNDDCYAERVSDVITIYKSFATKEVVGVQIYTKEK